MKTFQSTPITFIDQTDSRKLEVYITSNLPTVQIYNQNKAESEACTPDWTEGDDKLTLSMDVFLDSRAMTTAEYNSTTIKWYKNGTEMSGNSIEDISGDKRKIIIKDNILKDNAIITYTCEATYQGITASTRITFSRVDTGLNGQKGADGTSVRILGTAKSAILVTDTSYHTIVYDTGSIVAAELGDAYVLKDASSDLDGHLFVCALLNGGQDGATDYFIDAGQIQGPAGDPAKVITLIGSAQVFKVGKDGKTITPKAITITAHTVNIDDNSGIKWWYKYDTDVTWTEMTSKIIQDTNNKTIISINNSNDIATVNVEHLSSLTSIALRATYESAEDVLTLYKVFDGIDGEKGNPGDDAPIVLLSNEHISFVADANGETYGVQQNIPTNVVAYRGTTKVEPQINLTLANASLPEGMSISIDEDTMASIKNINPDFSEIILKVSVDSGVNLGSTLSNNGMIPIQVTSPADVVLQLNWTKVNAGTNGVDGKTSYLHIAYATSSDGKSGFSVSDSVSKTYIGQYTDYTEDDSTDPTKYKWTLIKGDKGDQGVQGPKGNDGQQLYTWIKYADTPTSGMSNDPTGKTYIGLAYNKTTATESSTYSDYMWSLIKGETGPTGPKGDNGQQYYTWIKYADNASGANMSDSPTGKLYIGLAYNKTTSTESNVATDYTWALFKGDKGAPGATGDNAVTFQVYSNNGYALSTSVPTITLQTFAYIGDIEIKSGATYQWYRHNNTDWVAVSGATNAYFNISRDDVSFSNNYMCKMQFNGTEYVGVVTIEDKNDENRVFASKPSNYFAGDLWIVGTDYTPGGYAIGTMLRAEHTNIAYTDSDWVPATKYDEEIEDLKTTVESYKQYFSVNSTNGLQIGNSSINNDVLTTNRVEASIINSDVANVETINVTGRYSGSTMLQAPILNLGNFSFVIEGNGSLSIVANT